MIARTTDGHLLAVGTASIAIPAKTRRSMFARGAGLCTVEGCGSTRRLQPHHIQERGSLGNNHHANLAGLCRFHHHVVIHGRRFTIEPTGHFADVASTHPTDRDPTHRSDR
jgi:hypothetical protein